LWERGGSFASFGHLFLKNRLHAFSTPVEFYCELWAYAGAIEVKPPNIRKEVVAEAQQAISKPGFTVDTLKLAERLVAVISPMLFGQSRARVKSQKHSPEDSQASESRAVESSESLNESAKRETL
jgi:hypothetical protein